MHIDNIPSLRIGNLQINPPIIQGRMGMNVSGANLASTVTNTGCTGVIASAGLGQFEDCAFAGSNASRCTEVVSIKSLVQELTEQLSAALVDEPLCPVVGNV
jgi:NAD(P)H-dependent flavin oxidoreductase YrpB (nitropropane dioxygenase family)